MQNLHVSRLKLLVITSDSNPPPLLLYCEVSIIEAFLPLNSLSSHNSEGWVGFADNGARMLLNAPPYPILRLHVAMGVL